MYTNRAKHTQKQVVRLEPSRRYLLTSTRPLTAEEKAAFAALVHDRMTEQVGVGRVGVLWFGARVGVGVGGVCGKVRLR